MTKSITTALVLFFVGSSIASAATQRCWYDKVGKRTVCAKVTAGGSLSLR